MNKLFSKIAALSVGLAMAVGVGVAVDSKGVKAVKAAEATWNASSEGFSDQEQLAGNSYSFSDSAVTISFAEASGNGHKWFNNGSAIRSYGGNSFTISCSGGNLTSITLSNNQSKEVTADVGTYSSNSWTGSASSVTFTVASGSGNFRTSTISAVYEASVDPTKKNMTIYQSGNEADGGTFLWSSTANIYEFVAKEDDNVVSDVTWSVSDTTVATINASTGRLTTVKPGNVTVYAEADGYNKSSAAIEITKSWVEELVLTGSMSKTSYLVGESWSHDGFVLTATYHSGWVEEVSSSATWTYNPASPAVNVESVVVTATFGEEDPVSSSAQAVTVTRTNPIQVLYSLADNANVDVYGVYVGFLDGTGPVIMDGEYGIVCYNKSASVSTYTAGETILHVTGKMASFNGLRQIGNPALSVASGSYEAPETPVVYATKGGETAEYASRLTTVTGVPAVASGSKGDFDSNAGTNDITMDFTVGSNSVKVFYKKAAQTADADAFAAVKAAVEGSSEITIKGFTGWYNGFQVQMNGYVPAAEGYTAEDFAKDLLDQTDDVCENYVDKVSSYNEFKTLLTAIWTNLASNDKYPSLPSAEKTILAEAERDESGTFVEQAMARYDFLTGKYELNNFINGRTPIVHKGNFDNIEFAADSSMMIIVITSAIALTSVCALVILKKKRSK